MKKSNRSTIFIFHFLPIELYPPAINFATYLSKNIGDNVTKVVVVTTRPENTLNLVSLPNVEIIRYRGIEKGMSIFRKIIQYFYIYGAVIAKLFKTKPQSIFYYESLSSLPFVVYNLFVKKFNLFIHYHELFTLEQLSKGRTLHKILNRLERKFLYSKAKWISQTNLSRLGLFLEQYHLQYNSTKHKILPNFPPKKWLLQSNTRVDLTKNKDKVKLLHIGALSFDDLFLNEVLKHYGNNDKFEITFYSHSANQRIIERLKSFKSVSYNGSINYLDIPNLKGLYDVGLVLYKGNSLNFTFNAPNKIFEYLALDLDVWCSDKLVTAKDYQIQNTYPKMLLVDFENLPAFNFDRALDKSNLEFQASPYYSEAVYRPLAESLLKEYI